jgi:hypothetical protein
VASYKLTVTGLSARTCPVSRLGGVDVGVGVPVSAVEVDVGVSVGVEGVTEPVGVGVSDPLGVDVGVSVGGVEEVGVTEPVAVGDPSGVEEIGVGVSDPLRVEVGVAVSPGVEGVGVKVGAAVGVKVGVVGLSLTFRLAPVNATSVRILSPLETRALQSTALCPACRPLAPKVNAAPPFVALLPLLPATATMNVPFWGPLIATTESAPKRLVTVMLLTSNKLAL